MLRSSLHDGAPSQVFSTATGGQGKPFCTLGVHSSNGGYAAIVDSTAATIWTTLGRSSPIRDTVYSGAPLPQSSRLFSANGLYFLILPGVQKRPTA